MAGDDEEEDGGSIVLAASILLALALLRRSAGLRRDAVDRLDRLEANVLARVRAADIASIIRPGARQAVADQLVAEIDAMVAREYRAILERLEADLGELGDTIAEHAAVTLRRAADQPVDQPPPESIAGAVAGAVLVGALLGSWMAKHSADTSFRLRRAITDAAANGVGSAETATTIRIAFGTARSAIETTVRSAVTATSAAAVDRTVQANAGRAVQGYLWVSILDGRTTPECRSRANLKWDADRKPIGHTKPFRLPPIHQNCRSSLIPWLADTRPPREPTLDEFLNSRTAAEQEALIGAKKIGMWREGKLTTSGLLDQSARPIPHNTLRRILGLPER